MNRKLNSNSTSGYKGVSWSKRNGRWITNIKINGQNKYVGSFTCLMKAAKAYDAAAIRLFKEFARLNFAQKEVKYYV